MKVERGERKFAPITITIESEDEYHALAMAVLAGFQHGQKFKPSYCYRETAPCILGALHTRLVDIL